ncbi:hypothetical protein E3J79_02795 [Candidatus Dependentiae bacterium]|nr:MAG: hypothetical protein E3J79_02795 [Candidatus Dependentiae bacterium]
MNIKKIALGIGCTLASSSLFGLVAEYKAEDKRAFNSLIRVWPLKLRSQEVRDQRIEDLACLSALMMNRLLIVIRVLKLDIDVASIEVLIKPFLKKALGKVDLFKANRYAVNEFENSIVEQRKKTAEDWRKQLGRLPRGEAEKDINKVIFEDALPKFNKNWRQVIRARRSLGEVVELPEEMTIKSIKKLGKKSTTRSS